MAKKTYDDKLKNINLWVEIVNYHWDRLQGELFNDEEFWDHTLHAMTNDDWWDWVDIEPALKIQFESTFRHYSKIYDDTDSIKRTLMLDKPVTKKNRKGKNFQAFRALMNIKDIINDINGTPTKQWAKIETSENTEPKNNFLSMFDFQ